MSRSVLPRARFATFSGVVVAALVAAILPVTLPVQASVPPEWRQEAEAFTTKTQGAQFGDANASGGTAWNLWTNGYLQTTFTATSSGAKQVDVVARGDVAAGVWPLMRVYYDAGLVYEQTVSAATYRTYSVSLPSVTSGSHTLKIEFGNDAVIGGEDRNLKLDVVTLLPSGIAQFNQQCELFSYKLPGSGGQFSDGSASGGAAWNIWSNGYIEHTATLATSGTKQINVVAKGDPFGGVWPNMRISVDGAVLANHTVGTGTWQNYVTMTTLSKGSHVLRIEFTNNASNATEDRNLRVDVASIVPVANEWKQEVEAFTTRNGTQGATTPSPLASAGYHWNQWSNGFVSTTMNAASAGRKTIEVVARGAHANDIFPIVKVYVDNVLIATQTIGTPDFTPYLFTADMAAGARVLKIEYTNNDTNLGGGDRNVHLDVATLLGDNAYPFVQSVPSPANNAYVVDKPSLKTTYADPDGDAGTVQYEVYTHPAGTLAASGTSASTAAGAVASWAPASALVNGQQYRWRARAYDGTFHAGAWTTDRYFTVDSSAPATPTVSSTTFPSGAWSGTHTTSGSFTFGNGGSSDVVGYKYGLDMTPPPFDTAGTSVTMTPGEGKHTMYVQSVDRAGNLSQIQPYAFNVGSGTVTSPRPGDTTGKQFALKTEANPALTSVTYQWRRAETDTWADIPAGHVTISGVPVTWPVTLSGGSHSAVNLTWDVSQTLGGVDGPVYVRASYNGGATTYGNHVSLDQRTAGGAVASVGSGEVNLLTGNLALTETDATAAGISVSRTYNSRDPQGGSNGVFGPGWSSALSSSGSGFTKLTASGTLRTVSLANGDTIGFTASGTNTFTPEEGLEDLTLTRTAGSGTPSDQTDDVYELAELGGITTVFAWQSNAFVPTRVEQPGSNVATTYTWETVGGVTRVVRALAPVPAGVTCTSPATTRGCRSITFEYAPAGTAVPGPSGGDYPGRVRSASFTAWNPATGAMATVELARWSYDPNGRLYQAWDSSLPTLKTTYAYDANGRITTITPPGEEPYTLAYTTLPNDPDGGRLKSVSRPALSAGTAVTTFVYGVPLSGIGAPADLSAGQLARWGQTDVPTYGTAIFPATQVPDGNQATGVMPTSYERAFVHYLDVTGREVVMRAPGGHLSIGEYDERGNPVRELTAANRARALDAAPSDTAAQEAAIAARLSTLRVYSADGRQLVEELGPEHEVTLTAAVTDSLGRAWPAGALVRARARTVNTYDEGAPAGGPFNLVTTARIGARIADTTTDADVRTVATTYDWNLLQPLTVTTDPGGLNLVSRMSYDATAGLVTKTTSPGGTAAQDTAHTKVYSYYTAGPHPAYNTDCGNKPEWANLVCRTDLAAQPTVTTERPAIPWTHRQYDMFGAQTTVTEKVGGTTVRTSTVQYDSAHRPWRSTTTATTGEPLPTREAYYDPSTGQETETRVIDGTGAVTAKVTRVFDTLGRITSYTDADSNVSTTTYDILSRPVVTNDGKGTQTRSYDEGTERRGVLGKIVDSAAGTFTAAYGTDGEIATETLPNGVVRTTTRNEVGRATKLTYTKGAGTWLSFAGTWSIHGKQTASTATGLSGQEFGYDAAGRLVKVADTPAGAGCTLRDYVVDAESNRTSVTTRQPTSEGECDPGATGSATTFAYDAVSRLTATDYVYDALGRTTQVPAGDAGGKELTATYFVNDLMRSLAPQDDLTTTWELDPTQQRFRSWTRNSVTKVNHYAADGDSPAWIAEGGTAWTRNVGGIDGTLAAVQDSATGVLLQLTDLHGDVVATATTDPLATGPVGTFDQTELGGSRDGTVRRYGWLGAQQRATDASGVMLMGVRTYNPTTGRFLQVDPVEGGSANAYEYGHGDPVNNSDPDGRAYNCNDYRSLCNKYGDGKAAWQLFWWFSANEMSALQKLITARALRSGNHRWGWGYEGCSFVPDWFYKSTFHAACTRHDFGWMNSKKIFGWFGAVTWGMATVNGVFFADMNWKCATHYAWWNEIGRRLCYKAAKAYLLGVTIAVWAYWQEYNRQP